MAQQPSLYMGMLDIDPEVEEEWNQWYDEVHVPEVLAVPGFRAGRRLEALLGSPKYLALYDLDSPEVLDSPALQEVRGFGPYAEHVRNIRLIVCEQIFPEDGNGFVSQISTRYVYMPFVNIDPEVEDDWNRWYNERHVPIVATAGLYNGHRYVTRSGPWKYTALYAAERADVLETPEIQKVRGFEQFTPHVQGLERHLYRVRS